MRNKDISVERKSRNGNVGQLFSLRRLHALLKFEIDVSNTKYKFEWSKVVFPKIGGRESSIYVYLIHS